MSKGQRARLEMAGTTTTVTRKRSKTAVKEGTTRLILVYLKRGCRECPIHTQYPVASMRCSFQLCLPSFVYYKRQLKTSALEKNNHTTNTVAILEIKSVRTQKFYSQ